MKSRLLILVVISLLIILNACEEKTEPTVIDEAKLFEEWESNCSNFRDGIINRTLGPAEVIRYLVQLKGRPYFVPPRGIECELLETLKQYSEDFIFVLIQFEPPIGSAEDREKYEDLGITLEGYIPMDSWLVTVPADLAYMDDLIRNHGVIWIGGTIVEDKVSPYILDGKIGSWAINDDGTVRLLVQFSKGTSEYEARKIVKANTGIITGHFSSNTYQISIAEDKILDLAKDYRVTWIELVPPPETIEDVPSIEIGLE